MPGLYVDTSSGRVLLAEPDAPAIRSVLGSHDEWWSSSLLTIERRRLARREGLEPAADRILDAIHLEAAIELHVPARSPSFSHTIVA
jgi:hypothetical protein